MLKRLTERVWYLPWEEETDRPNLCYLLGERHSLAVDAGNSPAHVGKLYRALEEQGLPLPDFTVLTHWHWDHTFGLGAIHGVGIASAKTQPKAAPGGGLAVDAPGHGGAGAPGGGHPLLQ